VWACGWWAGKRPFPARVFLIPLLVEGSWQLWLLHVWGVLPSNTATGNMDLPFCAYGHLLWATFHGTAHGSLWHQKVLSAEMLYLGLFAVGVTLAWLRGRGGVAERAAWPLFLTLAVCMSGTVWDQDYNFLRGVAECFTIGALILLDAPRGLRAGLFAGSVCVWICLFPVAVHRWVREQGELVKGSPAVLAGEQLGRRFAAPGALYVGLSAEGAPGLALRRPESPLGIPRNDSLVRSIFGRRSEPARLSVQFR
jgi:hypothetical protein